MTNHPILIRASFTATLLLFCTHNFASASAHNKQPNNTILFVWDGLRPDSINAKDTPNLYVLKKAGTYFTDNHSSYPTLTMVNAASFATGDLAGKTGFYGNVIWDPAATGYNAENNRIDFKAPVFTEDYKILADLNTKQAGGPLLEVNHLFALLHALKIRTAAVGKLGPAALQTNLQPSNQLGVILDEKHVYPLKFAQWMIKHNQQLPKYSPDAFKAGTLTLDKSNGNPTEFEPTVNLYAIDLKSLGQSSNKQYPDRVTTDPSIATASPYANANQYLLDRYLTSVIPYQKPQVTILWLRNPDSTEHNYGVGSKPYYAALRAQDKLLGQLMAYLKQNKLLNKTNIIVASDHSHSNVSGDLTLFPLRSIKDHHVNDINKQGYSVSGDFRPAALLQYGGFKAYDGFGCQYDPVLSGIKANGLLAYPIHTDQSGKVCHRNIQLSDLYGHRNRTLKKQLYTTADYRLPKTLPQNGIVVAANGGSTYFYVPSHDQQLIRRLVRFIQSREEFGPIFVHARYPNIPGTLSLSLIRLNNTTGKAPDVIASSHYNTESIIQGFKGTEYNSSGINRGMHGTFGRIDIHNTLIAFGPDFKQHFVDPLPTANVDVPNTIAYLYGARIVNSDGRVLQEALKHGKPLSHYQVSYQHIKAKQSANHLMIQRPTDPSGHDIDSSKHHFTEQLNIKRLIDGKQTTLYFDSAKERRY